MMQQVAIRRDELLHDLEHATQKLIDVLMTFDESELNSIPPTGGWSAGQVGEHLFKSDTSILNALYGPVKETLREPDAYVEDIKALFLDFSTRFQARDFILPTDDVYHDKHMLIMALKSHRDLIGKSILTLDLSLACTDPLLSAVVGEWTRLEYINFVIAHTHRHIHQLEEIFKHLKGKEAA